MVLANLLQHRQYKILRNYKKVVDEERPTNNISCNFPSKYAKNELQINKEENKDQNMYIGLDSVKCAKGSCYLEFGNTKILTTVSYPKQITGSSKSQINFEFKFAPFSMRHYSRSKQVKVEQTYSCLMKKALIASICVDHLNFNITISTLVIENDGSILSSAILCASLALSHSGFEMFGLITSITIVIREGVPLIDPNFQEEEECKIAYLSKSNYNRNSAIIVVSKSHTYASFCQVYCKGSLSPDLYKNIFDLANGKCDELFTIMQEHLTQFAVKYPSDNKLINT